MKPVETAATLSGKAESIRRVVIAQPGQHSIVASDTRVDGTMIAGIGKLFTLWGNDTPLSIPEDGTAPAFETLYPPPSGFRVYVTVYPAGQEVKPEARNLTGGAEVREDAVPGLHRSDTTDFDMVLKGTADCILSDGTVVTLTAGDTIVLNGADHAWSNKSTEDAVILYFMAGAKRA